MTIKKPVVTEVPDDNSAITQPTSPGATEILANTIIQVLATQRNAANDQLVMKEVELMQARSQIIALQARIAGLEKLLPNVEGVAA
ncbi:MAG TPA: hypothetical protein VL574_02635 [Stellaceae bacterium]|jgi:hypothetical protein|nr:hypothetical protein [Stellaceae bacterium]